MDRLRFDLASLTLVLYPVLALLCLTPWVSSSLALLLGVAMALVFGNPYRDLAQAWTHRLLSIAVIGLGAGMNLNVIGTVGLHGVGYTVIGITTTLLIGTMLGKWMKTPGDTSMLITVGTAICGGSAIAAVAPVLRAKPQEVSVSLGIVFVLNGLALVLFPSIGHALGLSETQFGLWSALAIHDTSSVVGATLQYGSEALAVGTTVKLARALWIIPVAVGIGFWKSRTSAVEAGTAKVKKPWFILGFILMAALVTLVPGLQTTGHFVESLAKHVLVGTLFLIGSNLTRETLKSVGFKPFIQGTALWLLMATSSLAAIVAGWLHL